MKKNYLFIIPILLLFACKKENSKDLIRELGFKMGSSYTEVYTHLQRLKQKGKLNEIEVMGLKTFSKPEELQNSFKLYDRLMLREEPSKQIDISFKDNKVGNITVLDKKSIWPDQWPQNMPTTIAISKNDNLDEVYRKLLAIYQLPAYKEYKLFTLDKSLDKPFDPNMAEHKVWHFWMSKLIRPMVVGRSSVKLVFENGKLNDIVHQYDEQQMVN